MHFYLWLLAPGFLSPRCLLLLLLRTINRQTEGSQCIGGEGEEQQEEESIMGAYLSNPVTDKESEDGEGGRLRFGVSAMQVRKRERGCSNIARWMDEYYTS